MGNRLFLIDRLKRIDPFRSMRHVFAGRQFAAQSQGRSISGVVTTRGIVMPKAFEQFSDNPEDRCPVMLVLDTSISMGFEGKIQALNAGLAQFKSEVLADPIASLRVEVAVITFGGTVQMVHEFSPADTMGLRPFRALGQRRLGEAVDLALDAIEHRKAEYKGAGVNYFRPWLWLITNGEPADEWRSTAARVRQAENEKKVSVFCTAVGADANFNFLKEFCNHRPPMRLDRPKFQEMLKWLSASRATGRAGSLLPAGSER